MPVWCEGKQKPRINLVRGKPASGKPDSVPIQSEQNEVRKQNWRDNLSGPEHINKLYARPSTKIQCSGFDCSQALAALQPMPRSAKHWWYGLAPSKDLAVSPLPFYPYSRVRPSTLGLGLSDVFRVETFLFAPLALRRRAVSPYLLLSVRTFLPY